MEIDDFVHLSRVNCVLSELRSFLNVKELSSLG
jgi:hypothetical protein